MELTTEQVLAYIEEKQELDEEKAKQNGKKRGDVFDICPRCGKNYLQFPLVLNATSRFADVYVCSQCGTEEALSFIRPSYSISLDNWFGVVAKKQSYTK